MTNREILMDKLPESHQLRKILEDKLIDVEDLNIANIVNNLSSTLTINTDDLSKHYWCLLLRLYSHYGTTLDFSRFNINDFSSYNLRYSENFAKNLYPKVELFNNNYELVRVLNESKIPNGNKELYLKYLKEYDNSVDLEDMQFLFATFLIDNPNTRKYMFTKKDNPTNLNTLLYLDYLEHLQCEPLNPLIQNIYSRVQKKLYSRTTSNHIILDYQPILEWSYLNNCCINPNIFDWCRLVLTHSSMIKNTEATCSLASGLYNVFAYTNYIYQHFVGHKITYNEIFNDSYYYKLLYFIHLIEDGFRHNVITESTNDITKKLLDLKHTNWKALLDKVSYFSSIGTDTRLLVARLFISSEGDARK